MKRPGHRWLLGATLAGVVACAALPCRVAWAQHADPHGAHTPPAADPHGGHGTPAAGAHGGEHHELGHINWVYGLLGEKDGITEPDLLYRPRGMPVPFLANLINFGLVVFLLVSKAGPMVRQALIARREGLLHDSEAAAKVKAEAQERFNEQQGRLDRLEEELARVRADYLQQGEREAERLDREARERHERMVRDAQQLVEQEGRALRLRLLTETADAATQGAEKILQSQLASSDQERLANEYLSQLGTLSMKRGAA